MKERFIELFGAAVVLGLLCCCNQQPVSVDEIPSNLGDVVFKDASFGNGQQLSLRLHEDQVEDLDDSVVYQNSNPTSVDNGNFIQSITATPLNGLLPDADTKGSLIDDWDGTSFSIRISFKKTSSSSWVHVTDNLSDIGDGTWRTGYYYNLTGCYFVWISIFSTNLSYEFIDGYPNVLVSAGQYSSQGDAVAGFCYLTSVAPGDYLPSIEITLKHVLTALCFTFSGQGPSGTINSITVNGKVGCYLDGEAFYDIDEYYYYNYSSASRSITTNKSVTSGSSSNILGTGKYLFLCHTSSNASITVSFSPSYGGTYSVTQSLSALSAGRIYNISLSFPSFPSSQAPYLYFSGGSSTENRHTYVDCNSQSVSAPISTNIDFTDPGTWGLSPSGYSLNMSNSSSANISVPANLYSYTVSHPSSNTYFSLSFDGPSGSPQDYVTSSNGLRIYQYGTSITAGPDYDDYNIEWSYFGNPYPVAPDGETHSYCWIKSTYNSETLQATTSESWIHIGNQNTGSTGTRHLTINFDANNTSSTRTGSITFKGGSSGVSPYNVSTTYSFSQEPNLTYAYQLEVPYYNTVSVGGTVTIPAKVYLIEYQGGNPTGNYWEQATVSAECTWDYNTLYLSCSGNTFTGMRVSNGYTPVTANYNGTYGSLSATAYIEVVANTRTNNVLEVSPSSTNVSVGNTVSLTATYYTTTETYTWNGSSFNWVETSRDSGTDVTSSASWTGNSSLSYLLYTGAGQYQGKSVGNESVTASYGGYEASASVTVTSNSRTVYELEVTPDNTYQSLGYVIQRGTVDFTAILYSYTEYYTYDGSSFYWAKDISSKTSQGDVSNRKASSWSCAPSSMGAFQYSGGSKYHFTALRAGNAIISCTYNSTYTGYCPIVIMPYVAPFDE